jgi:hypothetical protein
MHIISHDVIIRLAVPKWARNITARIRRVFLGFDEMTVRPVPLFPEASSTLRQLYMQELIDARRSGEKFEDKADLFSNLLAASEEEADDRVKLTDQELISEPSDPILQVGSLEPLEIFRRHLHVPSCRT